MDSFVCYPLADILKDDLRAESLSKHYGIYSSVRSEEMMDWRAVYIIDGHCYTHY